MVIESLQLAILLLALVLASWGLSIFVPLNSEKFGCKNDLGASPGATGAAAGAAQVTLILSPEVSDLSLISLPSR
jgi:hypothetical protein